MPLPSQGVNLPGRVQKRLDARRARLVPDSRALSPGVC
ncbi:hypothetical protein DB31_3621 [Hyalangium minutum]|uniref:Uncharacterized protein n=1 Tax=Hyalangium minutum TaxID=394096 RepID=A0A085WUX8_9BACT|nr:hypothetical protein DB31_3621 [Hyalangium minutum]